MVLLLAFLGCSDPPPPSGVAVESAPAAAVPVAPVAEPPSISVEPLPAAGSIGGEPILPRPIVLGAISVAEIDAGLAPRRAAIEACYAARRKVDPGLSGKVLVKFSIAHDGHVPDASVASTSLRDPETEACVTACVRETRFAPLTDGEVAMVRYPFTFPATSSR